jgi:hypothetical protein
MARKNRILRKRISFKCWLNVGALLVMSPYACLAVENITCAYSNKLLTKTAAIYICGYLLSTVLN